MDLLNRADCLGDDPSAPQGAVEAGLGEPQERVGECHWDTSTQASSIAEKRVMTASFPSALAGPSQGGRVVRCGVVVQAGLGRLASHGVKGVAALLRGLVLVRDDVGEPDPTVPARRRALEGDPTGLQELDQGGAADAEEVRGLLGGQQLVDGRDGDRPTLRQGADDVDQHTVRLHREADGLTVRPDERGRLRHLVQEA